MIAQVGVSGGKHTCHSLAHNTTMYLRLSESGQFARTMARDIASSKQHGGEMRGGNERRQASIQPAAVTGSATLWSLQHEPLAYHYWERSLCYAVYEDNEAEG